MNPTIYWFLRGDGGVSAECVPDRDIVFDDPIGEVVLAVDSYLQELPSVALLPQALWREFRPSPFNDVIAAAEEAQRRANLLRGAP